MKPQLLKVNNNHVQSFSVRNDIIPQNHNIWHYHEELELIHFEKGSGTQFIGDSVKNFTSGDIVLVGSNLPHYWLFDAHYLTTTPGPADIRVSHFKENFLGDQFFNLPENHKLKNLLKKAKKGIQLNRSIQNNTKHLIEKILNSNNSTKIVALIEVLTLIAESDEYSLLSSDNYPIDSQDLDFGRMTVIMDYITQHYKTQIKLDDIASMTGMTANSFCRYFKAKSGKTLFQYLIEMRIGYACKLLNERKLNVKQICFECGFQNFVSFHKYFKEATGFTPLHYQKQLL
ncbi:AraC family transcriptional regulator [Sphingobacterium sp. SRCM116780]|uniref:AraC family transcriptional regulator n=1 Tax=Sphingobacterium sp. SRCM116780 TaxID=2907623 RepID=UPI001F2D4CE0|nr:AraC family transcriptional regulator [Sphingobacterium sp. SRCM116780]UIR57474.1 AraC family transcriptional regulator [Sphingobacterium sp. SRCM116780]